VLSTAGGHIPATYWGLRWVRLAGMGLRRVVSAGLRPMVARRLLVMLIGVGACATGASASAQSPLTGVSRSLSRCVAAWNSAPLGAGREQIRGIAGFSGHALMFRFRDAGCGIAFSSEAVATSGSEGVYIAVLHGAYMLISSPLTGQGSPHPVRDGSALEAMASMGVNVRVSSTSGRVTALAGRGLPTVGDTILNAGVSCRKIITAPGSGTAPPARTPVPDNYIVGKSTAPCGWVRTVVTAYVLREGALIKHTTARPPERLILGWRCGGQGPWPAVTPAAISRFRLTCIDRSQVIRAQGFPSRLRGIS
jgi:hypothetical protein